MRMFSCFFPASRSKTLHINEINISCTNLPRATAPEEGDDEDEEGRDEDDDGGAVVHLDHVRLGVGDVGQVHGAVASDERIPAESDHYQCQNLQKE